LREFAQAILTFLCKKVPKNGINSAIKSPIISVLADNGFTGPASFLDAVMKAVMTNWVTHDN